MELGAGQVRVSPLRRDLQRAYLDAMKALLAPPAPPQVTDIATILREGVPVNGINDGRGAVLLALAGLSQQVKAAAGKAADTAAAGYLAEVLASLGQ